MTASRADQRPAAVVNRRRARGAHPRWLPTPASPLGGGEGGHGKHPRRRTGRDGEGRKEEGWPAWAHEGNGGRAQERQMCGREGVGERVAPGKSAERKRGDA